MYYYLVRFFFFVIPLAIILFFAVSLYRYCSARKQNKIQPGIFSQEEMKNRKLLLIVSSVVLGVIVAVVIGFVILLTLAVAYM